jgi:hypothetical protein
MDAATKFFHFYNDASHTARFAVLVRASIRGARRVINKKI